MINRNNNFFLKNIYVLYSAIFIIIVISVSFILINGYRDKKEELNNQKLFSIIEDNNKIDIKLLENFYKDNSITVNTKNFTGMALAKEYIRRGNYVDSVKIYDSVHSSSKDKFIRDLASYNSFRLSLLLYDEKVILEKYNSLISENNYLMDFIKEQYLLYLLEKHKTSEAKLIVESIKKNEINGDLFKRIEMYRDTYKF